MQEGSYLLKSNEISFVEIKKGKVKLESDHDLIDASELYSLVRPTPNRRAKLFFYNRIDTTRHKNQVERKEEKYRKHNEKNKPKKMLSMPNELKRRKCVAIRCTNTKSFGKRM